MWMRQHQEFFSFSLLSLLLFLDQQWEGTVISGDVFFAFVFGFGTVTVMLLFQSLPLFTIGFPVDF